MIRLMKPVLATIAISMLIGGASFSHAAPKISDRNKQKAVAEARRAELRAQLDVLKREISKTESAKGNAADTLAASEAAISSANRSISELGTEQQQTEEHLKLLAGEQERLTRIVTDQQQRLGKLLREQYMTGNENRLKLLLSGDNPNRINRELQYMGYVSQAQAVLIEQLRANLKAVEENKSATESAKAELAEIAQEKLAQKKVLEQEKARRAALLSQLSSKLVAQRKEAGKMERDQQRLSGLVDRLARLIVEQKKAAAARKRLPSAAKTKTAKVAKAGSVPPLVNHAEPVYEPDVPDGVFAGQRGRLKLPVRGTVTAKFGSKRDDGPSWKGLFIRAGEGAEIRAVAAGKVVFADWLRGFGNLIIIDHGSQYMTIYGNNQALLKHAGDTVKTGDVIASVGNSGGNEHSGLYFEMRHRGRAFDPLGWVTIR